MKIPKIVTEALELERQRHKIKSAKIVARAIENDYKYYMKLPKNKLVEAYKRNIRITALNPAETTKDQLATELCTFEWGKTRMEIWREHYC